MDTTKIPRQCLAARGISVTTDSGVFAIPAGTEFQLIAQGDKGFKGVYNGNEFSLVSEDFNEKR